MRSGWNCRNLKSEGLICGSEAIIIKSIILWCKNNIPFYNEFWPPLYSKCKQSLFHFLTISDKYRILTMTTRQSEKKLTVLEAFNSKTQGTIFQRCFLICFVFCHQSTRQVRLHEWMQWCLEGNNLQLTSSTLMSTLSPRSPQRNLCSNLQFQQEREK